MGENDDSKMSIAKDDSERKDTPKLVAVAIDMNKGSKHAFRWTIDNHLQRGQTLVLVHVKVTHKAHHTSASVVPLQLKQCDQQTKGLFLAFHGFCIRKNIPWRDIVLEDTEVRKALIEFVTHSAIDVLVLGAASRHSFLSKLHHKHTDSPCLIEREAPDFCSVYTISIGGKISSMRPASRPAPAFSTLRSQIMNQPTIIPTSPSHNTKGLERNNTHPVSRRTAHVSQESDDMTSTFIKFELPQGTLTDHDIHLLAKDDTHEACLMLKRDMEVVLAVHMKRLEKIKKSTEDEGVTSSPPLSPSPIVSQSLQQEVVHDHE